ncbi:MAG TPA: nucleotidyltransferase family protein [Cyclobacteriaceae bacterium]|nr:nucleotidyltransferase family protein [Cyclobacteriaceae bacterium]
MLDKDGILSLLKELKPILRKEFAVKEIGLFGSYSDETFREESDIDLLVELEKPIGWKFFSLELYLEEKFGRKIDLVSKNGLREQMREKILKEVQYV